MSKQENIPEAVASVTYSVVSPGGFPALFTVRGESGATLLQTMPSIEKGLADGGYKPQTKGYPPKQVNYVPDRKCPTCGSPLVYATKKDGTKFIKCSTNKWNPATNRAEGCPFVEWPETKRTE